MEFVTGTTILANISAFVGFVLTPFRRIYKSFKPKKKKEKDDRNNIVNIQNESGTVTYNEQIYNYCDD